MLHSTNGGLPPRHDARVFTPKLKVAVVRKHFVGQPEYENCDLINISHGGLGFASPWLNAKVDQKLLLEIYFGPDVFATRGIVTYVNLNENHDLYGAAFLYAPPELDRLIDSIKRDLSENGHIENPVGAALKKRHFGKRLSTRDLQVQVKKLDSSGPFIQCEVDNINKGGMGFYAIESIDASLPFDISIQISKPPQPTVISGKVHYMCKKPGGYYYGVEFKMITLELALLLDRLDDLLQP